MKKGLLLLLTIVLLMSGCGAAEYTQVTTLASCKTNLGILDLFAQEKMKDGDSDASDALSRWCWEADCVQMISKIIEEGSFLEGMFDNMTEACGQCWQSSALHPDVEDDDELTGIPKDINDICNRHSQFKGKED